MNLLRQVRALFDGVELDLAPDDAFDLQDKGTSDERIIGRMLARAAVIELLGAASDEEIRVAYCETTDEPGSSEADLLAGECKRRNVKLFVETDRAQ